MLVSMRAALCILIVLSTVVPAAAQPVSYQLKAEVPVGEKPQIRITAAQPVRDVRIEVDRDDGKKFTLAHKGLGKGQAVTLSVGDGAAGRATYKGTISANVPGSGPWKEQLTFETLVRAPLKVGYDADHLDLDKRVLQFKPSRAVQSAELVVIGEDGSELGKGSATYERAPGDGWHPITWAQPDKARVMMMKLRVAASDGTASNLELIPWSVEIEHEDVNFSTDSAVIEPGEDKKLDASLAKIHEAMKRAEKFMKMKLYVAGHTDTVGANAKNRKLSLDRAAAIASYFRKKGLKIPIAFAGFGEEVLKVKTADNTDERRNRRADYVLGPAAGAPPFKGPYLKARAEWRQLR
jgi:outer membrane protein OmpA-like peptidoglycan-associated protein